MKSEPVLTVAGVVALVLFGFVMTADDQAALIKLAAVAAPIVTAVIARRKVTPVP